MDEDQPIKPTHKALSLHGILDRRRMYQKEES
jgi:hypothetical protein